MMLTLTLGLTTSCGDDDTPALPTESIVAIAQGNSDLTGLVSALLKYPDLVTTLSGSGEFTVFAPTNAAFDNLLTALGQSSIDNLPEAVLRSVLEYHVVSTASLSAAELTNGNITTVAGEDITVDITGGVSLNGSANVVTADVAANNGIVHVIDQVLVLPSVAPIVGTIVAPAYFNKDFTTLIAAVQGASSGILTTLLNSDAKTLFAPTNEAFVAAGITALPDQATLDAVLTYHVIGSLVNEADIAQGSSSAPTLNGDIYLSNSANGVFINGTTQVTATDIAGSNGVVHVINRMLTPPSQTIAGIAVAASTATTPEFTQLVAALQKVPALLEAAGAEGNLTVFAPTDAAFQALYTALSVADLDELETTIGNDKLAEVLQHHIVGARAFSTDLASGQVTTLNQELTVDLSALTITDANSSTPAKLVTMSLNIHATNGVIHAVDQVLIPTGIL